MGAGFSSVIEHWFTMHKDLDSSPAIHKKWVFLLCKNQEDKKRATSKPQTHFTL